MNTMYLEVLDVDIKLSSNEEIDQLKLNKVFTLLVQSLDTELDCIRELILGIAKENPWMKDEIIATLDECREVIIGPDTSIGVFEPYGEQ